MTIRKRILFVQHLLRPPGGANLVAAWMLEALKCDHDLTLLTWEPVDWAEVRRFYGVTLRAQEMTIITVPPAVRALFALDPDPQSVQPLALLTAICKRLRHRYDLCLTACGEMDFGGPGLQYVHWPTYAHLYPRRMSPRLMPAPLPLVASILSGCRPWRVLSAFSFARVRRNLTLVNSDWSGRIVGDVYDIPTTTLYPPVEATFPAVPWAEREEGVVCIGRFHPSKRLADAVEIVARLRADRPGLHLHLIGSPLHTTPAERACHAHLLALTRANATWLTLHEDIPRAELLRLVSRHRYGLHTTPQEHFGLAPAEMVAAGCLVFVPGDGGQVEIVGDARLTFDTLDDAVAKMARVLRDPAAQAALGRHLAARPARYASDHFARRLRAIVAAYRPGMTEPPPGALPDLPASAPTSDRASDW